MRGKERFSAPKRTPSFRDALQRWALRFPGLKPLLIGNRVFRRTKVQLPLAEARGSHRKALEITPTLLGSHDDAFLVVGLWRAQLNLTRRYASASIVHRIESC